MAWSGVGPAGDGAALHRLVTRDQLPPGSAWPAMLNSKMAKLLCLPSVVVAVTCMSYVPPGVFEAVRVRMAGVVAVRWLVLSDAVVPSGNPVTAMFAVPVNPLPEVRLICVVTEPLAMIVPSAGLRACLNW